VLSQNYFLLENKESDFIYMKKLNQKKIRWIVREMDKGERSVYKIAKTSVSVEVPTRNRAIVLISLIVFKKQKFR